jgi:thymidylate synthase
MRKLIRDNIDDYQIDDFEIHNYQSYDANKMKMVA